MCTLRAQLNEGRLLLGMNRDDAPDRAHSECENGKVWYPKDSRTGGTCIGASQERVVALLNGHSQIVGKKSRGEIVPHVLEHGSVKGLDLKEYAPFQLFTYKIGSSAMVFQYWTSNTLNGSESRRKMILTSSSYGKRFNKLEHVKRKWSGVMDRETLEEVLKDHEPEKGTASVCMHGPESQTIGSTIIEVVGRKIEIYNLKGSPCEGKYEHVRTLTIE